MKLATLPSPPPPPAIESTRLVLVATFEESIKPFRTAKPDPQTPWTDEGALDIALRLTKGVLDLPKVPAKFIQALVAGVTADLGGLVSGPAAVAFGPVFTIPHTHAHPPALPAPLPGIGALLTGCVSVQICQAPAIRAGDLGLAASCGTTTPFFDVYTGSSSVFIGGSRAARGLLDPIRHCFPPPSPPPIADKAAAAATASTRAARVIDFGRRSIGAARRGAKVVGERIKPVTTLASAALPFAGVAQTFAQSHRASEAADARRAAGDLAGAEAADDAADGLATAAVYQSLQVAVDLARDHAIRSVRGAVAAAGTAIGQDRATSPAFGTILPLFPTVLIGGLPLRGGDGLDDYAKPPEPRVRDLIAARRLGDRLRGPLRPGRAENQVAAAEATVTGDPIDVVTGRVLLSTVDAHLPGPLPIVARRHYSSAWSRRDLGLGHGWSLSLDQALWLEPGQIVVRVADGRELTFPIDEDAERHHEPREGLTLVRRPDGAWDLVDRQGSRHRFAPVASPERPETGRCALVEIADASADHHLHFTHDPLGRLVEVRADGGRALRLRWDPRGHLIGLDLPDPEREGVFVPHRAYAIDDDGDLVAITDALGATTHLDYRDHRLIRCAEPATPAYHYEYEGDGHAARCVRAHGDADLLPRTITYDRDHGRTVVLEGDGGVTTYEHDEHLRVVAVTDAAGGRTAFEYDHLGRLSAVTDPLGHRSCHRHDASGRCVEAIAPDGATTRYEYAQHHAPIAATCPLGGRWTWRRDPFGRLVEAIDPLGRLTRVARERGLVARIDAADGAATELVHDAHGDLVRARLASGACLAWSHDRRGRLRVAVDARGNPRHFHHDLEGRLIRIDEPDGNTRTFEHDPAGRLLRARDRHRDLEFTWSGPGWLTSRSEGGRTVTYQRDHEGRVVAIVDAAGTTRLERDPAGRVVTIVTPDGARRRLLRDLTGRIVRVVRPGGMVTRIAHDPAGRPLTIAHADGSGLALEYRADGHLIAATRRDARGRAFPLRLDRDLAGRILREHQGEHWVASAHDPGDRRLALRSSLGARIHLRHREGGALAALAAALADARFDARFDRDLAGNELARHLPGGVTTRWRRDALGRPIELRVEGPSPAIPGLQPDLLHQQRYTWAPDRRLLAVDDLTRGPVELHHDPHGALTRAERLRGGTVHLRHRDDAGNLHRAADRHDRRYAPTGALLELEGELRTYDAEGRLLTREDPAGGRWRYHWDGAGLLIALERPDGARIELDYDALGRRVAQRGPHGETRWLWDGDVPLHSWTALSSAPVAPSASSSSALNTPGTPPRDLATTNPATPPDDAPPPADLVTWIFEPGTFTPLARLGPEGPLAVIADHRGVPLALVDPRGHVPWRAELDPDGALLHLEGPRTLCPFRLPGHHDDPDLDLAYNRFRYFDPRAGVYISPDPLGLTGGPRPYAYVDCPYQEADPLGLFASPTPGPYGNRLVRFDELVGDLVTDVSKGPPIPPTAPLTPSIPSATELQATTPLTPPRPAEPVVVDAAAQAIVPTAGPPLTDAPAPLPRPASNTGGKAP